MHPLSTRPGPIVARHAGTSAPCSLGQDRGRGHDPPLDQDLPATPPDRARHRPLARPDLGAAALRAGFAYVDGVLADGEDLRLCRLCYATMWGFAIY